MSDYTNRITITHIKKKHLELNNEVFGQLNTEFMENTNSHKYARLWTGKFHKLLNFILRDNDIEVIINKFPATLYFIQQFIKYFKKYGRYKSELQEKNIKYLFRGIARDNNYLEFNWGTQTVNDNNIKYNNDILNENSFLSTSKDIIIAEEFASKDGTLFIFNVNDLPDNIPFAKMDKNVADYLAENEILCLPYSTIYTEQITNKNHIKQINKYLKNKQINRFYKCTYKPNYNKVSKIITTKSDFNFKEKDKVLLGGNLEMEDLTIEQHNARLVDYFNKQTKNISLEDKYVIFYRAILGRPVEILQAEKTPEDIKEVFKFFRFYINSIEDRFDYITSLIPEVQDIKKLNYHDDINLYKKLRSYSVYQAIYNNNTKEVEVLYLGIPNFMNQELGIDLNRNDEIKESIVKKMNPKPLQLTKEEVKIFKKLHKSF